MKDFFIVTLLILALALSGCGPRKSGSMTETDLPGGGKMVSQEVGGEIRVTIFDGDGKILSEHVQDDRGDQLYPRAGAPGETRVMPGRPSSRKSQTESPGPAQGLGCRACAAGFERSPRPGKPCWCEPGGMRSEQVAGGGSQCRPCKHGHRFNPKPGRPCWCSPF